MTPVAIPRELLAEVARHARACFPDECCGYLVGPRGGDRVDELVACRNAQADGDHPTHPERGPGTAFVIAGAELFAFARSLDSARPARVVYHSHPNGRAYFSEVDAANARAAGFAVQHLVVGVTAAGASEAALFACDNGAYVELCRWPPAMLG